MVKEEEPTESKKYTNNELFGIEKFFKEQGLLFVPYITVYIYILCFAYQAGIFSETGLPLALISFNKGILFSIFNRLIYFIFLGFIINSVIIGILGFIPKQIRKILRRHINYLLFYFVFSGFDLSALVTKPIYPLYAFAIVASLELLVPIFSQRKIKGYLNKLSAQSERKGLKGEEDSFFEHVSRYRYIYLVGSILILYLLGEFQIKNQDIYGILETEPKQVILYLTDDYLLSTTLEDDGITVKNEFYYFDLNEIENPISFEEIGPLNFIENKSKLGFFPY